MAPTSWLSVLFFLLLIAPGLLFDLLAARRRVGVKESAFRETSRVILSSFAFSLIGIAVVVGFREWREELLPNPGLLLSSPVHYLQQHPAAVATSALIELATAVMCVVTLHFVLVVWGGARLRPLSAWVQAFRIDRPHGSVPYVRVKLDNGTVLMGHVSHYTADLELADRELVLGPPMFSKLEGGALAAVPGEWTRMVLRGSLIESINVQYRPKVKAHIQSTKIDEGHVYKRAAPYSFYLTTAFALVVIELATATFVPHNDTGKSLFICVTLGMVTAFTTFVLYVISTGARKGWMIGVLRLAIIVASVVVTAEIQFVGHPSGADQIAMLAFLVCQVAAVVGDYAAELRRKRQDG